MARRLTSGPDALGALGLVGVGVSVATMVVVGALGTSVAEPPLGGGSGPPWSGHAHPSALLVTALLLGAIAVGTAGVGVAYLALRRGWTPSPRRLLVLSAVAVVTLVLVPPMGSADHLSYAAYGRIAATGGNPYVVSPDHYRGDTDPVVSAVETPWRDARSVYGPVATALQDVASRIGGDSVRTTVWILSLMCGAAFVLTGWLLARLRPGDARPVVLWSLNPLLLWALVAGAHVDGLLMPALAGAFLVARRSRFGAGLLIGLAAAVKVTAGLVLLALVVARRRAVREVLIAAAGVGVVLAPAYALAGPHAYADLRDASKRVSVDTIWDPVLLWIATHVEATTARHVVDVLSVLLAGVLVLALHRLLPHGDNGIVRWAVILTFAYLLAAPYALPWYDALLWLPVAVAPVAARLVPLLLARSAVLASAYIPGRAAGVPPALDHVMLDWRGHVVPWLAWGLVAVILMMAWRGWPALEPGDPEDPDVVEPVSETPRAGTA
jgi:hypothetical protein